MFFVCMFPRLNYPKLRKATKPTERPPHLRFRRQLMVSDIKSNGTFKIASSMDPPLPAAYEDVCMVDCRFRIPKALKDLFVACKATMKIRVSKNLPGGCW